MWKRVSPLILFSCLAAAQTQDTPKPVAQVVPATRPGATTPVAFVDPHQQFARNIVSSAFVERQIALRRDTEKLLALAAELKANVDRTNPSILSLDVIRKAQEIEKLAKSVKEKMKDAY